MHLTLTRDDPQPERTLGILSIDGAFECYTIEDVVRPVGEKVPGKTAIPYGAYAVRVTWSSRFKRMLPMLIGDAAFGAAWRGVRIHRGNTEADTEGCIIVGQRRTSAMVLDSAKAEEGLVAKLLEAERAGEAIALDVVRG